MGQQRGVLPSLPFTRYICMAGGGGTTTINPSTKHKILLLPPFPSCYTYQMVDGGRGFVALK